MKKVPSATTTVTTTTTMKPPSVRLRCFFFLIVFLIVLNVASLFIFLVSNSICSTCMSTLSAMSERKRQHSALGDTLDETDELANRIGIAFPIMDIYRIDISCTYVTRDLGEHISAVYRNKARTCSLASLDSRVNRKLEKSFRNEQTDHDMAYVPVYNASSFDPFDNNTSEVTSVSRVFHSLQPGGVYMPNMIENAKAACKQGDIG